jgi:hypothetical protein
MKNFGLDKNLNEDLPMVLVENYDYQYTVSFDTIKNHVSRYPFCCDDQDLIIRRKRENYDFTSLFKDHIAMYIPSECYWLTDWRIKKFRTESNKYIIFDGDVLLYLSILDKENTLEILRAESAEEVSRDNII